MNFPWIATAILNPTHKKLFPQIKDKDKFIDWFTAAFREGDKVWLKVEKPSKSRTHEQFKYLYSCVYQPVAEYIGCTLVEIDGVMKRRLLTVNPDSPMEYVRNKTDLNRAELAEYIDGCRREAAMMGIETMDPIQ